MPGYRRDRATKESAGGFGLFGFSTLRRGSRSGQWPDDLTLDITIAKRGAPKRAALGEL
jgi:hypothetical protein